MDDVITITDDVNNSSSVVAASAKAVKTAYDKANDALPKSGGTVTGVINMSNKNITGINHIIFYNNSELWIE